VPLLDKDEQPLPGQTFTPTVGAAAPACPTTG
jgi:hypothetical protein